MVDFSTVSSGLVYAALVFCIGIIFITRKVLVPEVKRRLSSGKGWGWIRIIGPDKHEQEDFVNLRGGRVKVGKRCYIVELGAATYKGGLGESEVPIMLKDERLLISNERLESLRTNLAEALAFKSDKTKWKPLNKEQKDSVKSQIDGFKAQIAEEAKKLQAVQKEIVTFNLDRTASTMKGKYPVFTFRYDRSEPVDFFSLFKRQVKVFKCVSCQKNNAVEVDGGGHDSASVEMEIDKALQMGSLKDALSGNFMKKYGIFIIGAGLLLAANAYFSYENYGAIKELAQHSGTVLPAMIPFFWRRRQ